MEKELNSKEQSQETQEQSQEQSQQATQKQPKEPKQQKKEKEQSKQEPENNVDASKPENNVDAGKYAQYCSIKFLELSFKGTEQQLKKEDKDKMLALESELKQCNGKKPIRTITAAIDNEIVKLVEGVPVPKNIEEIVLKCKSPEYYFGE